jgi:hypothetical protein
LDSAQPAKEYLFNEKKLRDIKKRREGKTQERIWGWFSTGQSAPLKL